MIKAEFSETQFVFGYSRELLNSFFFPFKFYFPSTVLEKMTGADLAIDKFSLKGRYRYSEYYQFKRSNYYNNEVFDTLKNGLTLDTSAHPLFGFKIYNSRETKQFNLLKRLAKRSRRKVYYCAPLFYTNKEYFHHFTNKSILNNSKIIDLSQPYFQKHVIPLGSNHKILFDNHNSYICSIPKKIKGCIASERKGVMNKDHLESTALWENDLNALALVIRDFIKEELNTNEQIDFMPERFSDYNFISEFLLMFNIYWFPIFGRGKYG